MGCFIIWLFLAIFLVIGGIILMISMSITKVREELEKLRDLLKELEYGTNGQDALLPKIKENLRELNVLLNGCTEK